MRSGSGTKSLPPGVVARLTKSMMDCLALPSFQDGSGSAAWAMVVTSASTQANVVTTSFRVRVVFMVVLLFLGLIGLLTSRLSKPGMRTHGYT